MTWTISHSDPLSEDYALPEGNFEGSIILPATIAVVISLGVSVVLLSTDGSLLSALAFLVAAVVIIISCYRLDWGLCAFIGLVLMMDQFPIPGFDPWTLKTEYFLNVKENTFLPKMEAAVVNPLELQMFFLIFVWFVVISVRRHFTLARINVWPAMALFFLALGGALVYGLQTKGDLLPALWEVRALCYMGFLYLFVPQIIQTKKQLHLLIWVCIIAISFKAFQGLVRFALLGLTFRGFPTLTNHEDPVFILNLIVLLFALVLFQARSGQRTALFLLLLPLVLGFFTGQRRAAYAAIVPTFAVFVAALPGKEQRMFLKALIPLGSLLLLYCVVFWNSESRLASPVRLIKTGLSTNPEESGERYYSNLYREIEKFDLAATVQKSPIVGIGFGKKYEMPLPLVAIDFPLRDYIPHNQVLWVLVKTGGIGFCLLWFFLNSFGYRGAALVTKLKDPYLKAVCAVAVAAVINQIVVSNYDLQLTYYRNMVFLGTLMGVTSSLEQMDAREQKAVAADEINPA